MIKKKYPCTQAELYVASRIGWRKFLTLIGFFTAFKAFYTLAFQAAQIAKITAGEQLPSVLVRNSKVTQKLKVTRKNAKACLNRFQDIKSYIDSAFPEDEREDKYKEAGIGFYLEAGNDNWEDLQSLMVAGEKFLVDNLVALMANDNMPATFPDTFTSTKDAFLLALEDFYAQEESESNNTDAKIIANNLIYDALMSMLEDGHKIFRNDPKLSHMFTFEYIMSLVTNSLANLKGKITTNILNDELSGFQVLILETSDTDITDADGNYDFGAVAHGTYTVQISKPGYTTQTISAVEILTGTTKKLDVQMKKE